MAYTYKIIGDSCCDLPKEKYSDPHFQIIPLTLQADEHFITDDETFDQKEFLRLVAESPNCPKSACPSPEAFKEAYRNSEADMVFVVTLSKELSGSYNSARLGKELYEEEYGDECKICVLNSKSASSGEGVIAVRLQELCEQGLSFEEIEKQITEFIDCMKTWFVLETLDTLKKNGRLTGIKAFLATALNIKPVMSADDGVITQVDQARGIQKALQRMVSHMKKYYTAPEKLVISIAHCNNAARAEFVKKEIEKVMHFKKIYIVETAGVATMYANDGGIVIAA